MAVTSTKELGDKLRKGADSIEIEGILGDWVIRIKAVGKIAWGVCFAAMAVVIAKTIATVGTGGAAAPLALASGIVAAPIVISVLGGAAASAAIAIAVAGRSPGILTKLRKYKLTKEGDKVILRKP